MYKGAVSLLAKWGHPHDRGVVVSGPALGTSWCTLLVVKLGCLSCVQCRGTHTLHLKHLEAQNISSLAAKGCASVAQSIAHGCLCRRCCWIAAAVCITAGLANAAGDSRCLCGYVCAMRGPAQMWPALYRICTRGCLNGACCC